MGVELVEGSDLVSANNRIMMRTTKGFEPVDVLYRRIDDDFLDPEVFRADSLLGVPGLMEIYKNGRVALANAPGTGIADDKSVYAYVPEIIEYYLGEKIIIPNVPTYVCAEPQQLAHVVANLDKLVVKAVNESGGYGMLVGPHATFDEREEFARKVQENPRNYIGQPTLALSRVPVIVNGQVAGTSRRFATLRAPRHRHLRAAGRTNAGGAQRGFVSGQLVPGRGQQRHLGADALRSEWLANKNRAAKGAVKSC